MTTQHAHRNLADPSSGPWASAERTEAILTIEPFVLRHDRGLRRLLATLLGSVLDRRLAAGVSPEASRLLAARAERLASVAFRRNLVRAWNGVLEHALTAPRARDPHAPLCRDRVFAAVGDLQAMLSALSNPFPVPARGVALASRLLGDGTGPLYNRNCPLPLSDALRAVTAELCPGRAYTGASANRL
jgi:hypothetical protein